MTAPPPLVRKRAWPLITLAATSFIPGLGIFSGSAAVTWGLVTDRPRARLAIGLGAAGALLQIVGFLALGIWMRDSTAMEEAQTAVVANELTQLVMALDAHHASTGRYPESLHAVGGNPLSGRFLNIQDQFAGLFRMRPYHYRVAADGRTFDLFSVGPDREPDTDDDVRPVLPDSVLPRTGYQPSR